MMRHGTRKSPEPCPLGALLRDTRALLLSVLPDLNSTLVKVRFEHQFLVVSLW